MRTRVIFVTSLILLAMLILTALVSVQAAPPLRQNDLPSPTPEPKENTPYTLETVGGNADPIVFPGVTMDPFTLGDTTVTSLYPDGMSFSVKVESTGGDIQDVILFMTLAQGYRKPPGRRIECRDGRMGCSPVGRRIITARLDPLRFSLACARYVGRVDRHRSPAYRLLGSDSPLVPHGKRSYHRLLVRLWRG